MSDCVTGSIVGVAIAEITNAPMIAKRHQPSSRRQCTTRSRASPITTIGSSNTSPRITISRIVRSM